MLLLLILVALSEQIMTELQSIGGLRGQLLGRGKAAVTVGMNMVVVGRTHTVSGLMAGRMHQELRARLRLHSVEDSRSNTEQLAVGLGL